jgi:hypothetical protein
MDHRRWVWWTTGLKVRFLLVGLGLLAWGRELLGQGCSDIGGTWDVVDQSTIVYNIGGQIQTQEVPAAGPLDIQQTGCQIHFVTEGMNPSDGSIIRMPRDGVVSGNVITFSGQTGVIIPGATCTDNQITGKGTITGNTMRVTNSGLVECSVQGIPIRVTVNGVSVFTRSASPAVTLSGEVRLDELNGSPLAGVTVRLGAGAMAVTDAAGRYSFANLQPGSHTATPELKGYTFEPASRTVTVTQSSSLAAFVGTRIPTLRLTRVWSYQQEGPQDGANFLPPVDSANPRESRGAGVVGNSVRYFILGARGDGFGHIMARFAMDPPDSPMKDRVVIRAVRADDPTRTPVDEAPSTVGEVVHLKVDLRAFSAPADVMKGFLAVGWIDLDRNGSFDPGAGEVLVQTEPLGVLLMISPAHYFAARTALTAGAIQDSVSPFNRTRHPIAANFLYAFADGSDPTLATLRSESRICDHGELDFNTGVEFGADGCGMIYQYDFHSRSRVGEAILRSHALGVAAAATINLNRQKIAEVFAADPNRTEYFVEMTGNEHKDREPTGSHLLTFGAEDPDLGLAFGTATLSDAWLEVRRDRPDRVEVHGDIVDLYDWNYEEGFLDRLGAAVQAGYPTLGRGGRVFRLVAGFHGEIPGIRTDELSALAARAPNPAESGIIVLRVTGLRDSIVSLQRSSNLTGWSEFRQVTLSNWVEEVEMPADETHPYHFYRAVSAN